MCEPQNMMGTLLKKVFQVTTIANDLAQVYSEGLPKESSSSNDIEDFAERLGSNVGKLLRYATEFDPNMINTQQLYQWFIFHFLLSYRLIWCIILLIRNNMLLLIHFYLSIISYINKLFPFTSY